MANAPFDIASGAGEVAGERGTDAGAEDISPAYVPNPLRHDPVNWVNPMPKPAPIGREGEVPLDPKNYENTPGIPLDPKNYTPDLITRKIEARMNDYSWPEIDGQLATFADAAAQHGYSQKAIDDHLGYNTAGLHSNLGGAIYNAAKQDMATPLEAASDGLIKPTSNPDEPFKLSDELPDTVRHDYSAAITGGTAKGPQDFSAAYTALLSQHTGQDVTGLQWGIASKLPTHQEAIDYAIGVAQQEQVLNRADDTFSNLMQSWADTGNSLSAVYKQAANDPLLAEVLTTPRWTNGNLVTPQDPYRPQLGTEKAQTHTNAFVKYLQESGEALAKPFHQLPSIARDFASDIGDVASSPMVMKAAFPWLTNTAMEEVAQMSNDGLRSLLGTKGKPSEGALEAFMTFATGGFTDGFDPHTIMPAATQFNVWAKGLKDGSFGKLDDMVAPSVKDLQKIIDNPNSLTTDMRIAAASQPTPSAASTLGTAIRDVFKRIVDDASGTIKSVTSGAAPKAKAPPNPVLPNGMKPVPTSEIEQAIYDLQNKHDVVMNSIKKIFQGMPDEWRDDAFQANVAKEVETRMHLDPNKPDMSQPVKDYLASVKQITDLRFDLAKQVAEKLKGLKLGGPDVKDLFPTEEGYVHRIMDPKSMPAKSKFSNPTVQQEGGPKLDLVTNQDRTNKTLSNFASSMQDRSEGMYVLDDGKGTRQWGKDPLGKKQNFGDTVIDPTSKAKFTIARPTMEEIEQNTPIRYYKNHFVTESLETARLSKVLANIQFQEKAAADLGARGQYVSDAAFAKAVKAGTAQKGMVPNDVLGDPMTRVDLPGMKGWAAQKIAEPLNQYYGMSSDDLITKLNRGAGFLNKSLFWDPFPHAVNMASQWTFQRGFDWVKFWDYGNQIKSMMDAYREVRTFGPRYKEMILNGSSMPGASEGAANFYNFLLGKAFNEMNSDPVAWKGFANSVGLGLPELMGSMVKASKSAMWEFGDILKLNRELEYQRRGYSAVDAIRQSEKDMVSYRIPTRIMNSRLASQIVQSPFLVNFGRWKYGVIKSMSNMVRDVVSPQATGAERVAAIGKAAVLAIVSQHIPVLNSVMGTHGVFGLARNAADLVGDIVHPSDNLWDGQKDWGSALSGIVSGGPVMEAVDRFRTNTDAYGNKLVNGKSTPLGIVAELAEAGAGSFFPAQLVVNAAKHGAGRLFDDLTGFKFSSEAYKESAYKKQLEQYQAYQRERNDGFISWVENEAGQPQPYAPYPTGFSYHAPKASGYGSTRPSSRRTGY